MLVDQNFSALVEGRKIFNQGCLLGQVPQLGTLDYNLYTYRRVPLIEFLKIGGELFQNWPT